MTHLLLVSTSIFLDSQKTLYLDFIQLFYGVDIQEIPGEKTRSTLSLYTPQSSSSQPPTSLAWLTAPGIYTGTIHSSSTAPLRQAGDSTLDNVVIAPYPVRMGLEISPITSAYT